MIIFRKFVAKFYFNLLPSKSNINTSSESTLTDTEISSVISLAASLVIKETNFSSVLASRYINFSLPRGSIT